MKHSENLKINLSKFQSPKQVIECGIKKMEELSTPKTISIDNSFLFITIYNPDSPNFYETIKKSTECLKRNNVNGFENLKVIKSKRQAPNLKKILTMKRILSKGS